MAVDVAQEPTFEEAFAKRVRSTRNWVLALLVLNLPLVYGLAHELNGKASTWEVSRDALAHEVVYLAVLIGYALQLGRRPRPWVTLGLLAYGLADSLAASWVAGEAGFDSGVEPICCLAGLPKLGFAVALWRTFKLEREALARHSLPSKTTWAGGVGLAVLSAATLAHAQVVGERVHEFLQERYAASECKSNLKGWYVSEKAYFQEHDNYELDLAKLGFEPERGNRYSYFDSPAGPFQVRDGPKLAEGPHFGVLTDHFKFEGKFEVGPEEIPREVAGGVKLGINEPCNLESCQVAALCIRRPILKGETSPDVWSISTLDRKAANGELIPAGQPYHDSPPDY